MLRDQIRILTADDLSNVMDRKEQLFEVPEWGGAIRLRAMSLEQRDVMVATITDNGRVDGKVDPVKMIKALVLHGVVEPVITEAFLLTKSFTVVDRIAHAIMALNGMEQGASLTASATFRSEPGLDVPVSAGDGSGANGSLHTA